MKHSIALLAFLIIVLNYVNAQSKIQLGVRAGFNYVNNVLIKDNWDRLDDQREYRLGYHFGLSSRFILTKKISTSFELNYSNQGYHFDYQKSNQHIPQNIHYNYVTIPAFVEYRPFSKLTIQIGPQIGYLVSAKNKLQTETIDLIEFWKTNGIDYLINRFDFGLGLGTELIVSEKVLVGLRYFHGISSIIDHDIDLVDDQGNSVKSPNFKEQNRNLQLSFVYLLWSKDAKKQ